MTFLFLRHLVESTSVKVNTLAQSSTLKTIDAKLWFNHM